MRRHVGNVENSHGRVGLPPGSLIPVEVRGSDPVKIRVIRYNQKDFEEKDAAAIEDCLRPARSRIDHLD